MLSDLHQRIDGVSQRPGYQQAIGFCLWLTSASAREVAHTYIERIARKDSPRHMQNITGRVK